jgi:hypothetical protein
VRPPVTLPCCHTFPVVISLFLTQILQELSGGPPDVPTYGRHRSLMSAANPIAVRHVTRTHSTQRELQAALGRI